MNAQISGWLAQTLATDSPVLPAAGAMQVWLHLGWSVVLAWLGVSLSGGWLAGRRFGRQVSWLFGLGFAVWAWVPGPAGAAYWFGLAFQAPSVAGAVLCGLMLTRPVPDSAGTRRLMSSSGAVAFTGSQVVWLALMGVVLGWALLLDSFAVLPLQLYAWGFSPAALAGVVLVALLPWAVSRPVSGTGARAAVWVVPLAALVFVVWHLPTGNVWDAVLDPWAWLVLHGWLFRRGWIHYKNNS